MIRTGGLRRWLDRATYALSGIAFTAAFAGIRVLSALARIGRRPPRGPVRRVLLLAHDPVDQAGTRHRILAWADRLRRRGIRVVVAAPTTPYELTTLYGPVPQGMEVLAAITFVRRLRQVLAASRYDAALFARAVMPRFPWGDAVMARLLATIQPRCVLDLDDALWAYTLPPRRLGLLRASPDRTDRTMALVGSIAAGNETIAERARRFNPRVHVLPTCVDPDAVPVREHEETSAPVIGWIGTPGNLRHLVGIVPALRSLGAERAVRLRVVSSVPFDLPGIRVQNVRWSAREEARHVASFDVGLMPLEAGPATEGKCGLKLLQYAAAGVPAVASPVGVNREIVRPGETGFLAETQDEWTDALRTLLEDAALRARLGAAAREDARRRWSYDVHEPALLAALGIEPGDED